MKIRPFLQVNLLSVFLWATATLMISFFLTSCNNAPEKAPGPVGDEVKKQDVPALETWVHFKIKFKPNTTFETRDLTIRTIEKLLIDSIAEIRQKREPKFTQIFNVSINTGDTLVYTFSSTSPPLTYYSSIIDTSKCTCSRNCGVCMIITNFALNSSAIRNTTERRGPKPDPSGPYQNIADLSFPNENGKF